MTELFLKILNTSISAGGLVLAVVLLIRSVNRRRAAACPQAPGEAGIKEKVKSVLNYKKPPFRILAQTIVVCVAASVCFLTDTQRTAYQITVIIPAGSEEGVCYSHEEISPRKDYINVEAGEDIGETEISLMALETQQKNTYDKPTYVTSGKPVTLRAEKGGWFKVGVKASNPTNQDKTIYVTVQPVDVRIASRTTNVERPMLFMDGKYYVDLYQPVYDLPNGYEPAGTLSEKQANNTQLEGAQYFTNPNIVGDFYVYQECGTSISTNKAELEQCQWAYKRWTWAERGIIQKRQLTLDDVIMLSREGKELTWEDFEEYFYDETGSGLYIRVYQIDELYSLWIGGGDIKEDPMYIHLQVNDGTDDRIDIRDGGVEEFLK